MEVTILVLTTLLAVALGGALARVLRWPLLLVQMALGAGLPVAGLGTVVLDPQVFFLLCLPPLLFLDGWRIPNDALRRDARVIVRMALGLVIFTVVGLGLLIHALMPAMPLPVAFALAAVLSPTDPTAVSAIAARSPLPPRLMHVLQGEALFNDASGLVCLRVAVAATLTGHFSPVDALGSFLWMLLVGLSVGVGTPWLVARLIAAMSRPWGEDGSGQILLTLLLPFGVYLLAEFLHGSGILAAAAAGVTMSANDAWRWQAATRLRRTAVWDLVQTAVNGSIFVLLGAQIPALWTSAPRTVRLMGHTDPLWLLLGILILTSALLALRLAWVWVASRGAHPATDVLGPRAVWATSLAGVRGAVTLAAVMTLPLTLADGRAFPMRDLAIALAAGVIVGSMLLATLVLPWVLKGLDTAAPTGRPAALARLRGAAARRAIVAIEARERSMPGAAGLHGDAARRRARAVRTVVDEYRQRIERIEREGAEGDAPDRGHDEGLERQARLVGLREEREALRALAAGHGVDDLGLRLLVRELDHQEARLLG